MQLTSSQSKVFVFTHTGMIYAVPVDQLSTCEGASFEDLAISKVNDPVNQTLNCYLEFACHDDFGSVSLKLRAYIILSNNIPQGRLS